MGTTEIVHVHQYGPNLLVIILALLTTLAAWEAALWVLDWSKDRRENRVQAYDDPKCVECGCTQDDACEGGCAWVIGLKVDLCDACLVGVIPRGWVPEKPRTPVDHDTILEELPR